MTAEIVLQQANRHNQRKLTTPIGIDGLVEITTTGRLQVVFQITEQMLQNIGMTLARRWDAQGLTRVTVNTPPAKTGGVFTYFPTLLFYEMARPERLPEAMPLAPSGPPAKPAFCAASRLVELPAA
jgi:hypothetical protein